MKVEVSIDLDDFIERWADDTFERTLKDDIKYEVMKAVKNSEKYQSLIKEQIAALESKLHT